MARSRASPRRRVAAPDAAIAPTSTSFYSERLRSQNGDVYRRSHCERDRTLEKRTAAMAVSSSEVARPTGAARRGHRPALALTVIAASQLMVVLDATIVNIALPQVQRALGFSTTDLSWVLNAYTLTFGGLLLLGGRAGDILGRRRVFIAGILVFTLASFLGGLATSAGWLLAARALQGVGGAIAAPTALALVTTNFAEGPERNRAFGVFGAVAGAGGALGLLAGGMLTSWLSWRWVLFVNVPIGVLLALLAPRFITESERQPGRFDLAGALTSTAGMTALVYGFISAAHDGWSDPVTVGSFTAAAVLLAAFFSIETRTRQPITPLHMFADRNRAGSYAIMLSLAAAMFGMFFFLTLFVQDVLGYTPLRAGLSFLPVTAAIIASSQFAARSLPRLGPKRLMTAGAARHRRPGLAQPALGDQRLPGRPARPHGGVRPRHGPAVRPPHRGRRLRRPTPRRRRRLQPPQRHATGRRLPRPLHPGHRLRHRQPQRGDRPAGHLPPHRPTRSPGSVPADRPAPSPLGPPDPCPWHLHLVPARGRVRRRRPGDRPAGDPPSPEAGGGGGGRGDTGSGLTGTWNCTRHRVADSWRYAVLLWRCHARLPP